MKKTITFSEKRAIDQWIEIFDMVSKAVGNPMYEEEFTVFEKRGKIYPRRGEMNIYLENLLLTLKEDAVSIYLDLKPAVVVSRNNNTTTFGFEVVEKIACIVNAALEAALKCGVERQYKTAEFLKSL